MAHRLPILTHPDTFLRKKALDVSAAELRDKEFLGFLEDMSKTMLEADGIGLAAIQVGDRRNITVINMDDGPMHFVNPKILQYGKKKDVQTEGCLSVPGLAGDVRRSLEIHVTAIDRRGAALDFTAHDLLARVLQHEIDHLNGILYIDRAEKIWEEKPQKK